MRRGFRGAALALALSAGALMGAGLPAMAQPAPARTAQEAADEEAVRAALTAQSFEALKPHLRALQEVLDHAPASFPTVEERGEVTTVRADEPSSTLVLALLAAAAARKQKTSVVYAFNTYPTAAFLLGSYADEMKQPAVALTYLDRGLAMQPQNGRLTSEKAIALVNLHRPGDALAMIDAWLAANPLGGATTRARLLRNKGFALVELERLDEGEAAYRESLKVEPGHKGALYELDYIGKLRAGGAKLGVGQTTAGKARAGAFPKPGDPPPNP